MNGQAHLQAVLGLPLSDQTSKSVNLGMNKKPQKRKRRGEVEKNQK